MSHDDNGLDAFLLTRQWRETDRGLELLFWVATDEGPLRLSVPAQTAVAFIPSARLDELPASLRRVSRQSATALRDFAGEPVTALYFNSQRQLLEARDRLRRLDIKLLEGDIKPTDRFLMERFLTGALRIHGDLEQQRGFRSCVSPRLSSCLYRPTLSALSLDIETDMRARELYSIALYGEQERLVLMRGEAGTVPESGPTEGELSLRLFDSEAALIEAALEAIRRLDPDVLIGWNVVNFDLRKLQDFADRAGVSFALGRGGETIGWRQSREGRERHYATVPGRLVLDGIELMRSATYQFDSFSLEWVARELLGRGKLITDVDQRGAEISELFLSDKVALARYNLEDCRLVWDIFAQEKLLDFAVERSLLTGLEPDRYGGSVAALDFLYLPRLHRRGFVAPAVTDKEVRGLSPGGYVLESEPGIHRDVVVLDFKSLYPSIIRSFGIDPLAMLEAGEEEDPIPGFEGASFSRREPILPALVERLWEARDQAKARGDRVLSNAIKIIMNSFYGVLGARGCRFFDPRLVSSITRRGHEIILRSKELIEERGYPVIYGDTDSVFVHLAGTEPEKVPDVADRLASELNNWWRGHLAQQYRVRSCLEIEFETHFSRFLMPRIRGADAGSKKRYAGLLAGGGLVFKGLESVRSDWSVLARQFQQELYRRIFADEPYIDYIEDQVARLMRGEFEDELVLRKRLRRKLSDYVKNVPPHVQAARRAERERGRRDLPDLYGAGGWIEYLMTINGPEPRQYRQSAIDYEFYLEKQLTPIADAILVFDSSSMDEIINQQIGLF